MSPSRAAVAPQAAPEPPSGGIPAQASERAAEGHTAAPPSCGHPEASPAYCPKCRTQKHDRRYTRRHTGHDIVETAATRRDGRHYRQCITCAPWREPLDPDRGKPDPIAITRAISGDPPEHLSLIERRTAIRALAGELPPPVIAARIGCSERTVWRHLAAAA